MQLIFNNDFTDIIGDIKYYWKVLDDVPNNIQQFIYDKINKIFFYDYIEDKYYCPKCLKQLENNMCTKCSTIYDKNDKYMIKTSEEFGIYEAIPEFYVFDFQDGVELLYNFKIQLDSIDDLRKIDMKVNIENIYEITDIGIYEIINDKHYFYKDLSVDSKIYPRINFLYLDNLEQLKNSYLYKYTILWNLKYDSAYNTSINLYSLTYYPLYYRQFEYLMKMKLYNLACNCPYKFTNNIFINNFGVDKNYLPFMKDININEEQLQILQLFPTKDKSIIDFFSFCVETTKNIVKYVKLDKLKNYLESQNLNKYYLGDYELYLKCCEKLGLNLKEKKVLFPKNLISTYDKLELEIELINNGENDKKIKSLANILSLNIYEDDKFIIFPANGIESLINESRQMSNCVREYSSMISKNLCQIYFMRYKDRKDESFVTIEVNDGKIVQARTKFNKLPDEHIYNVLECWEKSLIPIYNE